MPIRSIDLSKSQADTLLLILSRMSFDDYLKLTDGGEHKGQAYEFIDATRSLRLSLEEIKRTL